MLRRWAPWWVYACAVPFVAYFGLLVYCDVWRPESEGAKLAFDQALTVEKVEAGSPAGRAGLCPGDRIVAADGRPIGGRKLEWVAVGYNVEFDKPIVLDVVREGRLLRTTLVFGRASWARWATREGIDLLASRFVQLVSLGLGLLILFRRPDQGVARLGAWVLGSVGVFSVVLPYRFTAVWRELWWPLGVALWLPLASSLLLAALLLTFFLIFPVRRVPSFAIPLLWLPVIGAAAPFVRYQLATVYWPLATPRPPDGLAGLLAVSMAYLAATVVSVAWSYRRLADETERRRLRVLLAGAIVGCPAAGGIVVGWWQTGPQTLFASPVMGWLVPLLVTVPLAFAYAILRHRLFDVRLIIRQGVRYALARRLMLSLVPALLALMVVDLSLHRDQPMGEVVATRATAYLLLSVVALVAQFQRQHWLLALDRRFFRERYDAQRLLKEVADDIREAGSIERVAARVVAQIELALHPRFVMLLLRAPAADAYRPVAAAPAGTGPSSLPAGGKLVALTRVLGHPLEISARESGWLGSQLPEDERKAISDSGLELLVPVLTDGSSPEALIALGARRSDEPYAREDQDLLQAIAATLGLLLARGAAGAAASSFRECPSCGACYDEAEGRCRADGAALAPVALPRVLDARYRLERRLGRGGMGTVYAAGDLALQRRVAVKVLREDLVGDGDAAERFEREARTAAAFSHPHVVTVHDVGITARGRGFLVMELLEGRTLRAELSTTGALDPGRAVRIVRDVCGAVDAAHRRRLVHRDLKPENVFLATVEGVEVAKVLDFGIAKAFRAPSPGEERQTAAGLLLGTPEYMAPEQLRGEDVNPSWDLWALGVMVCEMLTGRHPFSAVVVGSKAPAVPAGLAVLLNDALAGFDARLSQFVAAVLAVDPARRPPSASALAAELERILLGAGAPSSGAHWG